MEEKEQAKVKQEKAKKKVNQSTLVCVVIIFLLIIALMVVCYFGFLRKDNVNDGNTTTNNITNSTVNNTNANIVTDNNIVTNNVEKNNIVNTENNISQEKQEELNLTSSEVKNLVEKFNFNFLSHSIYKVGDFDSSNIPNDLVLRLGWNKVDDKDRSLNTYTLEEKTNKEILAKSIRNIFGKNVSYKDKSFRYGDVKVFSEYATEQVYYNNDGIYNSTHFQGGGSTCPFVYEQVQKAEKYDDKIKLYVKAGFVDTSVKENGEVEYHFYKNYNFNRDEFENKLITVEEEEFINEAGIETQLSLKAHKSISSIMDKLNTYIYTFTLDKDSGEYYFTAFNKV